METPANNHHQSLPSLCSDELFEVYSWLPAKSVIKLTASLKNLATVFSEPHFIHNQSTRSSATDFGFFLQPEPASGQLKLHPPPFLSPADFGIPPPSLEFMARTGRVVGASGGLVLLKKTTNDEGGLLIFNPATKKWAAVENPKMENVVRYADEGAMVACGATKGITGNRVCYIVAPVLVEDHRDAWSSSYRLAVFHDGKWEVEAQELKVEEGRDLRLDMPVGTFRGYNGGLVVHYLCNSLPNALRRPVYLEPYIAAYDVKRGVLSRRIRLPEGAWDEYDGEWGSRDKLKMFEYPKEDSICLVRTDYNGWITVWTMEDYDGGVWRRVMSKTTAEMGVEEEEEPGSSLLGCCTVDGERQAVVTRQRVYGYMMTVEEEGKLEVMGEHGCGEAVRVKFTLYANTFEPVLGEETGSFFCISYTGLYTVGPDY